MQLTDSVLRALADRPEVVAEFPELKRVKTTGCGSCQKARASKDVFLLKTTVANMPTFRLERLKHFLNTDKLTIAYTAGGTNHIKTI